LRFSQNQKSLLTVDFQKARINKGFSVFYDDAQRFFGGVET
jgi:hypothetical protein